MLETDALTEFRGRVRAFLERHAEPLGTINRADESVAVPRARAFQQALAAEGLAGITYPVEYGGAGLASDHQEVFDDESEQFDMPSLQLMVGLGMCAPTLLGFGTEEQKRRFLPGLLSGEVIWCQLFSEPGAGSDVASLTTKAVRDGDEWLVSGQKVWTSMGHHSGYGLLLARTNPDVPKHKGITMFILDMTSPGITIRPLRQMDGLAHFNEVFLDEVRLPADALIGPVDGGWGLTLSMLANERNAIGAGGKSQQMGGASSASLIDLAQRFDVAGDADFRQALADVFIREQVLGLIGERIRAAVASGRSPGPEGSVAKLAASTLGKMSTALAVRIVGAAAQAWEPGDEAAAVAAAFLEAPMLTIAGGTSEIQRNIIGERVLGLPREPA